MSTNHTPGPWRIHPFGHYDVAAHQPGFGEMIVANCGGANSNVMDLGEIKKANARLIAAAPDLLAALKDVVGWIETSSEGEQATRIALAAIAKAEGRT